MRSRCLWTKGAPVVLPSPARRFLQLAGRGSCIQSESYSEVQLNTSPGLFGEDERAVASYVWLYDLSPGESRALLWFHELVHVPLGTLDLSSDESRALL